MNIAFPALLIFLLVLPGAIFYSTFHNIENTQLNYEPFARKAIESITVALIIHSITLVILHALSYKINFDLLLAFLLSTKDTLTTNIIKMASANVVPMLSYIIFIYVLAWLLARFTRVIIRIFNLDRINKIGLFFRPDNDWYYLFKGYDWDSGQPDVVLIAATVELAGKGYLYIGVLEDFFLDEKGNIERLVLIQAQRRNITDDKNLKRYETAEKRFYKIDGDYFVLKYSEVKTLNVQFMKIENE